MRGSITVEASLVFPIILVVVVMIIKLGLFIHDRSVVSALDCYYSCKAEMLEYGYSLDERRITIKNILIPKRSVDRITMKETVSEYAEGIFVGEKFDFDFSYSGTKTKNGDLIRLYHNLIIHGEELLND